MKLTLDQLAGAPERAAELADEERKSFALKCIAVLGALAVAPESKQEGARDRLLAPEEAAPRMGTTANWMRRKGRRLPFARRVGRFWRFSENGLNSYLAERAKR
jgi:hypothetical protein